jgi:hypothetical protein
MWEVMNACVIMHSMTIESEHDAPTNDDHHFDIQGSLAKVEQVLAQFYAFLRIHEKIRDTGVHTQS